jgi:aspartate/methionine/tyrosine aminotransferase
MKPIIDLSWGDPIVLRQALVEVTGIKFPLSCTSLLDMGYTEHNGSKKLIEQLKNLEKRQTGHKPKYLFVTCGATGALNAALYASKYCKAFVVTNKRYYPLLPSIVSTAGLSLGNPHGFCRQEESIFLIDSPSAPEGKVFPFYSVDIYDAAYASKTYTIGGHVPNKYKILCGSLSKTLGLPGLRLGWISTDDSILAMNIEEFVTANYAGLSRYSMDMAEEVLEKLDFDSFEKKSSYYLDCNREEVQKLFTKFGQGSVPIRGMFAILQLGKSERKALEKANIKWQPGNTWGEDESWARLNLGQTRELINSAIKIALK